MQLNGKVDTMDRDLTELKKTMHRELPELHTKLDAVTELLKQMAPKGGEGAGGEEAVARPPQ